MTDTITGPPPDTQSDSLPGVSDGERIIMSGRYKDVQSANTGFQSMWRADLESCRNRALMDALFNNAPPYDAGDQYIQGRGDECNVNWGWGDYKLREAFAPYPDL